MTTRYPLTVNTSTNKIEELPVTIDLDLGNSNVVGAFDIVASNNITANGILRANTLVESPSAVFTVNLDTTTASNVLLGSVDNVHITGGNSGQVLTTDGAGNLVWANASVVGGSNTYVQFNNANILDGHANFTYNQTTSTVTLQNLVSTTVNNSANITTANLTVDTFSNLGAVANLMVLGGNTGDVLKTYGNGVLYWEPAVQNKQLIEFVVNSNSSGQSFTNANIALFPNKYYALVFVDGVVQQTAEYSITGNTITINGYLQQNQVVTISPSLSGYGSNGSATNSGNPAGQNGHIQFNDNAQMGTSGNLTYDVANETFITTTANIDLVNANNITVTSNVPLLSTSSGLVGQITFDSNYVYVCIAPNSWKRIPLTSW